MEGLARPQTRVWCVSTRTQVFTVTPAAGAAAPRHTMRVCTRACVCARVGASNYFCGESRAVKLLLRRISSPSVLSLSPEQQPKPSLCPSVWVRENRTPTLSSSHQVLTTYPEYVASVRVCLFKLASDQRVCLACLSLSVLKLHICTLSMPCCRFSLPQKHASLFSFFPS